MALWDFLKPKPKSYNELVPEPVATEQDKIDMVATILKDPRAKEMIMMPGCDRYTNSPCAWSRTDPIEDKCRMCGTQFPGWS